MLQVPLISTSSLAMHPPRQPPFSLFILLTAWSSSRGASPCSRSDASVSLDSAHPAWAFSCHPQRHLSGSVFITATQKLFATTCGRVASGCTVWTSWSKSVRRGFLSTLPGLASSFLLCSTSSCHPRRAERPTDNLQPHMLV